MNHVGTIADVTRWAEECLPGEESRARSAIVTIRKAGLFSYGKNGPRGRSAAFMMVSDFATAICAVLHQGAATKADEAVQRMWSLRLSRVSVFDSQDNLYNANPRDPYFYNMKENIQLYLDMFGLGGAISSLSDQPSMRCETNLIGVLSTLFTNFAPHKNFHPNDDIQLEAAGDKFSIKVRLNGSKHGTQPDGWPGEGIEAGALWLTFGDISVFDARGIKTTRTLGGAALNALSMMTPNRTKGEGDDQ